MRYPYETKVMWTDKTAPDGVDIEPPAEDYEAVDITLDIMEIATMETAFHHPEWATITMKSGVRMIIGESLKAMRQILSTAILSTGKDNLLNRNS